MAEFDAKWMAALAGDGRSYRDSKNKWLTLRDGSRAKTWYCVAKRNGKTDRVRLGTYPDMTITTARKAAIEYMVAVDAGKNTTAINYTLRDVYEIWREDRGKNKRSAKLDEIKMRRQLATLADCRIVDIQKSDIEQAKSMFKSTPAAFDRALTLLRTLYQYADIKIGIDVRNVAAAVEMYPEQPRRTRIDITEIPAFFRELSPSRYGQDFCDIVLLLLYTGQRSGNVMAMEWEEISGGVWIIPGGKSKNGNDMVTPLTADAEKIIERRRNAQHRHPIYVFPASRKSAKTEHYGNISKRWKKFAAAIGRPELHVHDIRRAHGTIMLNAGASIEQVSAALHHSSISITQRVYADILTDAVRAGQDKFSAAISAALDHSMQSLGIK